MTSICGEPLRLPPSPCPPGGLAPEQVPQFVIFGNDDNGYAGLDDSGARLPGAGGTAWFVDLFDRGTNPRGRGNPDTFDGRRPHFSLMGLGRYIAGDRAAACRRAWRMAFEKGHDIGNHTHNHPHGTTADAAIWEAEIRTSLAQVCAPWDPAALHRPDTGMGVPRESICGFRAPYLQYNDHLFCVLEKLGFAYDASIEEGFEPGQDGTRHFWPYTLHGGSPANPAIGAHPGILEIPVYPFLVPSDDLCARYGVSAGLRKSLAARESNPDFSKDHDHDYVHMDDGRIRGMDYDLWKEYRVTAPEMLALLKYTLDVRLRSNRAPMSVCMHSDFYTENPWGDTHYGVETHAARQWALESFFDYALSLPAVRIVSNAELVRWLRHPVPL